MTITLSVTRDDTSLYEQNYTVSARSERVVAGFTVETLPDDLRLVTIQATDSDRQPSSVNVSVSDCLGDVIFIYGADGSLESTYSIC